MSAHNILLINQLHCHVSPSRCKPLSNAQHECAVSSTEVDYFARSHAAPMLQQRARHDTVGHRNGIQAAEISPKVQRARIVSRNVIRQFGFNSTEQEFLHSQWSVHLMRQGPISLGSQVFSLRREFGDGVSLSLRPFHYRDRATNQHEEIVRSPLVVGHEDWEVSPEGLQAQLGVKLGRQHTAKSYLPY